MLISAHLAITRELQTEYTNSFTEPSDRQNADAILQISVSANREI